ncbi:hypothetical protein Tco_0439971 [Tanacetum coccineum]
MQAATNSPPLDSQFPVNYMLRFVLETGGKKKPATAKQPKSKPAKEKSSKPAPASKPKVTKEKPLKPSPAKHPKRGKVQKLRKGKPSLQLIDEDEPTQPEPEPEHQGEGEEYDVECAIQMSMESRTPATKEASTDPFAHGHIMTIANIVRESPSHADAKTGADTNKTNYGGDTEILQTGEEQGDEVATEVNLEEKTSEIDEGQAGSDPGKTPESQPPPDDDKMDEDQAGPNPGESHVALAGPNPEPTHDEFMANVYPNVHESLKFPVDEHVILEDLLSSIGTLSLMKNLDDAFTIGDQFINNKSTEDEPEKLNVEAEVVSMVIVPIYQASSSVPPLSTPVIDLSPPKPVSSTTQAPIVTATITTTTTTLPPHSQQQSITELELAARVATLKQNFSGLEQKSKNLDNTTQNLRSRVFTLELRDLPHKIDETVRETMKEAVHVVLQAPLRDRFRDQPEADMKEMLHQRMFKSGSYKSHPEHVALYEALEASMERAQRDEFLAEKDKSQKRRHGTSSKQKSGPDSEQPVEDIPMPDTTYLSDSEDTNSAHLLKIKPRPEWLKPIPEEDRPSSLKPDWSIPTNDLPEPENNWANALAKSYEDLEENKLLWKTVDMGSFISWFCKRIGKTKFSKSDLEGPSFKIESEREYDISAAYGISRGSSANNSTSQDTVPLMIAVKADYKEYKISEADFKNLHPNDFKDLYLLHLQGQLNHLSGDDKVYLFNVVNLWIRKIIIRKHVEDLQLGIESYQTKLNLTQPDWDASDFLFKEDYTIVTKPRAVIYRDRNDQKKMMRENEVHKFSDGTLNRILDKLDHMVKDFKLYEYNPGMETRIWSVDDRRRSKDFMEVHIKMEMVSSCSGRDKFITACPYLTDTFKEIMKVQAYVSKLSQL